MKILFFFFIIFLMSCNATKWKQRYANDNFKRIQQQYGNSNGTIQYAGYKSKVPNKAVPPRDSTGFISAKYYQPITSLTKKQVKITMREWEWAAAIVPDSVNKENDQIDSIYMNPYKIRYLEDHHLKTDRMIFHDTTTRTSNRRV